MYSLKGKVAEKVSRLFADPHSSGPSTTPIDPLPNPPQEESHTEGGKSLSSFFSHISFDALKSIPCPHNVIPIQSLRVRWRSAESEHPDEPSDSCTDVQEEEEEHSSRRSTSSSETFEDAISPTKLEKEMPKNLADESAFISSELYEFLQSCLPNIVKGCQWVLLYSTLKHGTSLRTLIRKSADVSGHCLLIVGDMQGAVFGGLLECPLKPTAKRRYQGTNQTFVFTTIYGEPRLFRPTGANRYFCMCLNDLLALGGGGNFALRLNEDLLSGTSGPCETFGNRCLAHNSEFELKNVELWGFTHSSRYHA